MASLVEYTARDVAAHKSPDDAWMIIHGKVYNITDYLEHHPGGAEVLHETAGIDASEPFDNAGHSDDAFEIMEAYCVGKVKGGANKTVNKAVRVLASSTPKSAPPIESTDKSFVGITGLSLGALALSYAAHQYFPHLQFHLPSFAMKLPWMGREPRGMGFLEGLLLGAGILTVVDAMVAHRLLDLVRGGEDFMKYPPHVKIPKSLESDTLLRRGWLDPNTYYPLPLAKKTLIAPNVYLMTFALPTPQTIVGLPTGQHVAIQAEVNGEKVTRSYTPVSNNSDRGVLELLIKVYPDGKLTGGYLAKLDVGDEVLFRGPKGAMRYTRGLCKKIGMVAGGSGITPMFQLIRAICENDKDLTEISLIYANRTEQDILLRDALDAYARKYPKNFKVHYMLDQPPEEWKFGTGFVTKETMAEKFSGPSQDTKVMICGPPGMVNGAKKSLVSLGYAEPSAMSKITDQIFTF